MILWILHDHEVKSRKSMSLHLIILCAETIVSIFRHYVNPYIEIRELRYFNHICRDRREKWCDSHEVIQA